MKLNSFFRVATYFLISFPAFKPVQVGDVFCSAGCDLSVMLFTPGWLLIAPDVCERGLPTKGHKERCRCFTLTACCTHVEVFSRRTGILRRTAVGGISIRSGRR